MSKGRFLDALFSQVAQIEELADRILREIGIQFEGDSETIELWKRFGARVDGERVYLNGADLRELIRERAPRNFTVLARDPDKDREIGQSFSPVLAPVYGPPNVLLRNGQRVAGSRELYREMISMANACEAIGNTGHMLCVMNEVAEGDRPLEMARAHLEYSGKSFMGSVASPEAALAVIELTRTAIERRQPDTQACHLLHLINSTPPLVYKSNPLKCIRAVAEAGEGIILTSYMMLGATGPVTLAGALAQGYAECLAGLALAQLWQPGTPVIMGLFATQFSMRTMQPWFGDPLSQTVQIYAAALARHLGVPVRGDGGITSSFLDDAQAGYEGGRATSVALTVGCDFILHAVGWLESGRTASLSKFEREASELRGLLAQFAAVSINEASNIHPKLGFIPDLLASGAS